MDRVHLNGDREKRLPGSVNFSFEGVEGESLLLMLDMKGTQPPPARPAPPALSTPAMCCLPSACPTPLPTAPCGSPWATTTPPRTWTIFLEVLPGIIQR